MQRMDHGPAGLVRAAAPSCVIQGRMHVSSQRAPCIGTVPAAVDFFPLPPSLLSPSLSLPWSRRPALRSSPYTRSRQLPTKCSSPSLVLGHHEQTWLDRNRDLMHDDPSAPSTWPHHSCVEQAPSLAALDHQPVPCTDSRTAGCNS